jgi:hypothetical protein
MAVVLQSFLVLFDKKFLFTCPGFGVGACQARSLFWSGK